MADRAARNRPSVIPTMRYRDAPAAIDWLCKAFGFEQRLIVPGDDELILHAQLAVGNGMVMLGSARDDAYGELIQPPDPGGPGTQSPYVIVDDVDAHYACAVAAGAEVMMELKDEQHGRGYSCRDPEGHLWNFGNYDPWAEV